MSSWSSSQVHCTVPLKFNGSINTWSSFECLQWGRIYMPPSINKKLSRKMVFVRVLGHETIDHIVQAYIGIHPLFLLDARSVWKFMPSQCFLDLSPSFIYFHLFNYVGVEFPKPLFWSGIWMQWLFHEYLFLKWVWTCNYNHALVFYMIFEVGWTCKYNLALVFYMIVVEHKIFIGIPSL